MEEMTFKIYQELKGLVGKELIRLISTASGKRVTLGDFIKNFKVMSRVKPCPYIIRSVELEKENIVIRYSKESLESKDKWSWCKFNVSQFTFDEERPYNFFISYDYTKDIRNHHYKGKFITYGFFTPDTPLDKYKYDEEFKNILQNITNAEKDAKFESIVLSEDNLSTVYTKIRKMCINKKCSLSIKNKKGRIRLEDSKILSIAKSKTTNSINMEVDNNILTNYIVIAEDTALLFYPDAKQLKINPLNDELGFIINIKD